MKLICEGRCGRGAVRQVNQDNLFVNGQWRADLTFQDMTAFSDVSDEGIYAVCDGMGGEHYGEEASLLAAEALRDVAPEDFFERGEGYLIGINTALCKLMRRRGCRIGTTFVSLTVSGGRGRILNIGDSRAYLLRAGRLIQCSRDHTQARQMVNMGILTEKQAAAHPDRHKLTQHLGIFPEEMLIEPYVSDAFPLKRGDLFLLCSDGLTEMLAEEELSRLLGEKVRVAEKAARLYQTAARGGRDNITVLLVQVV